MISSNEEGNYNNSLRSIIIDIKKLSKCKTLNFLSYRYKSFLYQKLAETLMLKGDHRRADMAIAKSRQAQVKAKSLLVEEVKKAEGKIEENLAKIFTEVPSI